MCRDVTMLSLRQCEIIISSQRFSNAGITIPYRYQLKHLLLLLIIPQDYKVWIKILLLQSDLPLKADDLNQVR